MTSETATIAALWVAVASLIVSTIGIILALFALRRGNRNSAATLSLAIHESFRQAWQRCLGSEGESKDYEFHELMNLVENACAMYMERNLVGVSRRIMEQYLIDILGYIERDADARQLIKTMRDKPDTFEFCVQFLVKMRSTGRLKKLTDLMTAPDSSTPAAHQIDAVSA